MRLHLTSSKQAAAQVTGQTELPAEEEERGDGEREGRTADEDKMGEGEVNK